MAKSHKIEYDIGKNPEGTSTQQVSDTYYDDSGTPVPQIQTTDLGKVLTAGANDPVWAEGEGGGTWGSITGDIADQVDLSEALGTLSDGITAIQNSYVTKDTVQTLTGAKTWTDSNNSTIINAIRMDNVQTSGSNKYEARTQPNGYRSAYIDSSQNWTGFRLMSPANPSSNPISTLYHYVTRNGTQSTYTINLPEGNGTLALNANWILKYDWDLAAIQAGEKTVDFTGYDEMMIVTSLQSASINTSLYGRFIYNNSSFDTRMIYSTTSANTKYKTYISRWIDQSILLECVSSRYEESDSQPSDIFTTGSSGQGYDIYGLSLSQLKVLYIDTPESLSFGNIKIYVR